MTRVESREPPAEIGGLRERIERWRRSRRVGDAMPRELWAAAVSLARAEYTVYQVCRWLKVDHGALKRRVAEAAEAEARPDAEQFGRTAMVAGVESVAFDGPTRCGENDEADALRFIEVNGESLFGHNTASEQVVELVGADGARMTIRQPAGLELDVTSLATAFWRRSPCYR